MATIKLQPSGKVVIKDGKVACACCGCCMYPAQALFDGLYTYEGLPEQLNINFADGELIVVANRLETPIPLFDNIAYYSYTYAGSTEYIFIENLYPDPEIPDEWIWNSFIATIGGCLVTGPSNVEDQFADSYTVSGSVSGTVTRESICVWRGAGLTLTNFGYQWKVNGNNKSGFQNTPVGSYGGGYFVS